MRQLVEIKKGVTVELVQEFIEAYDAFSATIPQDQLTFNQSPLSFEYAIAILISCYGLSDSSIERAIGFYKDKKGKDCKGICSL